MVLARGPPVIDLREKDAISRIDEACRSWGAFVATGHSVDADLLAEVLAVGHRFFDLPVDTKERYSLTRQVLTR